MPVRKIPLRYSSLSGTKYSEKNKRSISYESSLESDFVELIEWDNRVHFYEEQPYKIEYLDSNSKLHSYTPDFLVSYKEPLEKELPLSIIYEIKYSKDLKIKEEELKSKFLAAKLFCEKEGFSFKVVTEKEIRTPYLENIKFLKKYKRQEVHLPMSDYLLELMKKSKISTPEEIISSSSMIEQKRAMLLYTLWVMIANSTIMLDMTKKITMNSKIWFPY